MQVHEVEHRAVGDPVDEVAERPAHDEGEGDRERARAGAQRDGQAERVAARSGKRIGRDAKQAD